LGRRYLITMPKKNSVSGKIAPSKTKQSKARAQSIPESGPATVVVSDADGQDVTPRSLLPNVRLAPSKSPGDAESGSHQSSALDSAFGRTGTGMSSMGSEGETAGGAKTPDLSGDEASASDMGEIAPSQFPLGEGEGCSAFIKLTDADLEEMVSFELTETETFFLTPYIPGECVAMDAMDADAVKVANVRYDELLANRVAMADLYTETSVQTFNPDLKMKDVQTADVRTVDMGSQATSWDLYDVLVAGAGLASTHEDETIDVEALGSEGVGDIRLGGPHGDTSGAETSFAASGTEASSMDGGLASATGEMAVGNGSGGDDVERAKEAELRALRGLPDVLRVVERMVSQNIYQSKHLQYRHIAQLMVNANKNADSDEATAIPSLADSVGGGGSSFSKLWSFASDASQMRNVSCLQWNPENRDLLAAGYGEFDFEKQDDGVILFWSLKNPDSPDKIIHTPCGVTAIAFSRHHPNLLAAGLYDGTVCIFDVRKDSSKPVLESGHGPGVKHTDPVWQLTWVDHGTGRGEVLVSISSDGRVTKWDMRQGLENQDLMKLKRVVNMAKQASQNSKPGGGGSEGIISRRASGMCIAFSPKDPNLYMAGTEDGAIHKCSCSYNEQHLETFFGHSGPVYKLQWSPFCPNTFLSCSADWSIKLWHQECSYAIFTFFSTTDYVADVCWSPYNSTVFASVTGDGRVDVWDISVNTLDPLSSVKTGKRLSTVAFSMASPVLVVGHEGGGVDVYSLEGALAEPIPRTVSEQIAALNKHMVTEDTKQVDAH